MSELCGCDGPCDCAEKIHQASQQQEQEPDLFSKLHRYDEHYQLAKDMRDLYPDDHRQRMDALILLMLTRIGDLSELVQELIHRGRT